MLLKEPIIKKRVIIIFIRGQNGRGCVQKISIKVLDPLVTLYENFALAFIYCGVKHREKEIDFKMIFFSTEIYDISFPKRIWTWVRGQ